MSSKRMLEIEDLLNRIWKHRLDQFESSFEELTSIDTRGDLCSNYLLWAQYLALVGHFALYKGDFQLAKIKSEEGLGALDAYRQEIFSNDPKEQAKGDFASNLVGARLHNTLGIVGMVTSDFGTSIVHYKNAVLCCERAPQDDLLVMILFNLGELYRGALDQNDKALPFFEKALVLLETTPHFMEKVIESAHKLCLIRMGRTEGMLDQLRRIEAEMETLTTHKARAGVCQTIAQGYRELGENEAALRLVAYGLSTFNTAQDYFLRLSLWLIGAQALTQEGDYQKALSYCQSILNSEVKNQNNSLLLNIYKTMGRCYGELGMAVDQSHYLGLALICMEREISDHIDRHTSVLVAEMNQKALEKDIEIHRLKNIELKKQSEKLEATAFELQAALDDLMAAQEHLVRTEKLAALGELVAGVSHEINTPLGVGITIASYIGDYIEKLYDKIMSRQISASQLKSEIDEIISSVDILNSSLHRSADIVNSFKQVATDQSRYELREFNVHEYLSDLMVMLGSQYDREKYHVYIHCNQRLQVKSYPGAFSQIVNQLVLNAMVHGFRNLSQGQVHIEVDLEKRRNPNGDQISSNSQCDLLRLRVRNNGRMMEAEERERMFNPFFTTNRNHGNIGLGLHTIHNLVTQVLEGSIDLCDTTASEGSEWTCFEVVWPVEME